MNSRLSKMLKNFFAAFSLKPFFMTKRMILTPRTKIFSRRFRLENRSGLPQRASLPPLINKLNFNRNIKFSNLSSEERVALKNLSKRKDIIVKAADKGRPVGWGGSRGSNEPPKSAFLGS